MSYLTDDITSGIVDVPIALPQTLIGPNESLVISTIQLKTMQVLKFRWANLHLVKTDPLGSPVKVNSSFGLVYLGLYAGHVLGKPTGTPLASLNIETNLGVKCTNPFAHRDIAVPDTYQLIVTNNTSNLTVSVVASGAMRIYLKT